MQAIDYGFISPKEDREGLLLKQIEQLTADKHRLEGKVELLQEQVNNLHNSNIEKISSDEFKDQALLCFAETMMALYYALLKVRNSKLSLLHRKEIPKYITQILDNERFIKKSDLKMFKNTSQYSETDFLVDTVKIVELSMTFMNKI